MQTLKVLLTGTSPLKMHNERLANPLDKIVKRIKAITSKRKKTDDDQVALMELEFEGGLYFDDKHGPYFPAKNAKAMILEGAKKNRGGKNVAESLQILDDKSPLIYKGPRDVKGLWAAGTFHDVCGVGVGPRRIMRTRPMFFPWGVQLTIVYDETVIDRADLLAWIATAGTRTGSMDHRPEFGKFDHKVVEG